MKKQCFKIERVCSRNFQDFIRLINNLAEYEKLEPPNIDAIRRLKRDLLSRKPKCEAYVGRLGDQYIAYMIFLYTYSSFLAKPTLYLEDIFILKEQRKKGFGQIMFDFCQKKAKQKGCSRMEWIVLNWNKTAQKFYEKNGAKKLDWYFYRKEIG